MLKTNNKQVRKAIREHIEECCEGDFEVFQGNAKSCCAPRERWQENGAKHLAGDGEFLIYYCDVRSFLAGILQQTPDEALKYSDDKCWNLYCYLIGQEGAKIIRNGGWIK